MTSRRCRGRSACACPTTPAPTSRSSRCRVSSTAPSTASGSTTVPGAARRPAGSGRAARTCASRRRPATWPCSHRERPEMSPLFGHGDLRLYLLHALADQPRHGYELIRHIEDRFLGMYSPSPRTNYPRLAALEEDGLIERNEEDGRKGYRITAAGREELERRHDE